MRWLLWKLRIVDLVILVKKTDEKVRVVYHTEKGDEVIAWYGSSVSSNYLLDNTSPERSNGLKPFIRHSADSWVDGWKPYDRSPFRLIKRFKTPSWLSNSRRHNDRILPKN